MDAARALVTSNLRIRTGRSRAIGHARRRRMRRDDAVGPIHVAIAALEFCFQSHFEMREIDHIPARKIPVPAAFRRLLQTYDEMTRIIAHFVRTDFRLHINRPQTPVSPAPPLLLRVALLSLIAALPSCLPPRLFSSLPLSTSVLVAFCPPDFPC